MRRIPVLFLAAVVASLLGTGCSEDSKVVGPKGVAVVMGQVYIWNCGVGDGWNNAYVEDFRFTARTGQAASVRFLGENSGQSLSTTADLDGFAAVLDTGTYDVIVETEYTYPDTFKTVHVAQDTVLELKTTFWWHMADSILGLFAWAPSDTIGEAAERKILDSASVLMGPGMLAPEGAVREVQFGYDSGTVYITYKIPIGEGMHTWQVVRRNEEIYNSYHGTFPGLFGMAPDMIICMDASSRRTSDRK